jgi:PleD family two-component response regulator
MALRREPESLPKGALMFAERIHIEMSGNNVIHNYKYFLQTAFNIRIYFSNIREISGDQVVSVAEEAAYRAKIGGKIRAVARVPR